MSKNLFDGTFNTPEPFGDECEWWAVSRERFPTKTDALAAFIAANNTECGMEEDERDLEEENVKPAFVRFWEDEENRNCDEKGVWWLSPNEKPRSYPVWALDTQAILHHVK